MDGVRIHMLITSCTLLHQWRLSSIKCSWNRNRASSWWNTKIIRTPWLICCYVNVFSTISPFSILVGRWFVSPLPDTWSTCTHMNVIRGVWATPTSSRPPSTVIGARADDRASAVPSSPTRPTGPPPCCHRPSFPRPLFCQWAPMGSRWPQTRRSRKVRDVWIQLVGTEIKLNRRNFKF